MISNNVRDVVFEQNYGSLVDAMIRHNVQFNVGHVLSRIEMMILIEAEEVRKNGGDDTPLINLVKNIRQTFIAPQEEPEEKQEAVQAEDVVIQEEPQQPSEVINGSSSAKIFSFDKAKS